MKRKKWILGGAIFIITCAIFVYFISINHYYSTRELHETIEINGKQVHIDVQGTGGPTVIFEPGLNESYTSFISVKKEITKSQRTFLYDRIALNRSRPATSAAVCGKNREKPVPERNVENQVADLHALLKMLKIKGPYILVAHSISGFNARVFATTYPKEVAGIVLIDCSYENQEWTEKDIPITGELNYGEILYSATQVRKATKLDALRNIPLVVLTADYKNRGFQYYSYWLADQNRQAKLSGKSKHIIVENSGHLIQVEHPEAVVNAIQLVTNVLSK